MESENLARREEINEHLAMRRIKNSVDDGKAIVQDVYAYIIDRPINVKFNYIAKLYIDEIGEEIYINTTNFDNFIDIFADTINLSNAIDHELNISIKETLLTNFEKNTIKIYECYKPHVYHKDDKKEFKGKFKYYQSVEELLDDKYRITVEEGKLYDIDDLLKNNISKRLESNINRKLNRKRDKIREKSKLEAHISDVKVYDEKIELHVRADNVNHKTDLIYTFTEPLEDDSLFMKFIDEIDVNSVDELELLPVWLTRDSSSKTRGINGWYITEKIKKQREPNENKTFLHSLMSSIIS